MEDPASRQRGRKVLVVDDDPEVIQILKVNLAHANFDTISAQNGTEALTKAYEERPDLILLDVLLPDLDGLDVCRQLNESPQASHIPVIIISAKVDSEDRIAAIAAGAEGYITKPFAPAEVVALVDACFKRMEEDKNVNPLTRLPDRTQINNRITALIKQNKIFAAIYVDIDYLKTFNYVYGFPQGDRAIQLLAEILREAVRLFGNPDDVAGHLDGDDFVVISTPQKARILCRRIIADFDSRVRSLYSQTDLDRGYMEYQGRFYQREQCPIMSLSIAVITNEKRAFDHYLQVTDIAAELRDFLRSYPGSNYYFDRRENGITLRPSPVHRGTPPAYREELKTMHGVLAWVVFLARELETPINAIKDCLESLPGHQAKDFDLGEPTSLEAIQENIGQLLRILAELEHLKTLEWATDRTTPGVVDLREIVEWIMSQVQVLAEQRGIEIDIEGVEDIGRLMVNGRGLAQGLFYLLRNEIKAGAFGDRVQVCVSEASETFIIVEVINRNRYIPPGELATLFRGQLESLTSKGRRNDLYLAKVLLHALGGKLSVRSQKGEGSIFTIVVPKRWRSSVEQVNRLQSEAEQDSMAARAQLENIRRLLSSTVELVPPAIAESLDSLSCRVQELEVLCNRSLFLADDLTSELEREQDRVLQQETEQLATSEAVLAVNRQIARLARAGCLFDVESAKRVAKNALAIADEFKLSRSEQQILYCAALLKDLGTVSLPKEMLEQRVPHTLEKVTSLRELFNVVEKALWRINFLAPVLSIALHSYERYDGTGYPSGLKGAKIPFGARILAIVDAFDTMTSGLSPQQTLEPEEAVKGLAADSGHRFDPQVVSTFLRAWRRRELQVASIKTGLEVRS